MLEGGKGVGITCSAYTGVLPAWGEVEIRVDLYSDMCSPPSSSRLLPGVACPHAPRASSVCAPPREHACLHGGSRHAALTGTMMMTTGMTVMIVVVVVVMMIGMGAGAGCSATDWWRK